jgi:hypothetical protein
MTCRRPEPATAARADGRQQLALVFDGQRGGCDSGAV